MVYCTKKPKCSREPNHPGSCNKKRDINTFYTSSPVQEKNQLTEQISELTEKKMKMDDSLLEAQTQLEDLSNQTTQLEDNISSMEEIAEAKKEMLSELEVEFDKVKLLLDRKNYGRTVRENCPTNYELINDHKSLRYKRLNETKNMLEYIHGGPEGALYGALDFIKRYAKEDLIEKFILDLKRGKFIEKLYGNFSKTFSSSAMGRNQAIAKKYHSYLSGRKYDFIGKIETSAFDPSSQKWNQKSITYMVTVKLI